MCDVCIAEMTRGKGTEMNGYEIRSKGKTEFGPAKMQIKKQGDEWPEHWIHTYDLAGTVSYFGFDAQRSPKKDKEARRRRLAVTKALKSSGLYCHEPL